MTYERIKMAKKVNLDKFEALSAFEMLVFKIMLEHEKDGIESTLENVNFKALPLSWESRIHINEGETTAKALKKVATPNKTTGEWKLKAEFFE